MRIDRMVLAFPDMKNVIVDNEALLKNYNLDLLAAISVRVDMKPDEFAAFREWKAQHYPSRQVEKRSEPVKTFGEHEEYAY